MIFVSHSQLQAAKKCELMVADATFNIAPRPYLQFYVIHGLLKVSSAAEDGEWVKRFMKSRNSFVDLGPTCLLAYDA